MSAIEKKSDDAVMQSLERELRTVELGDDKHMPPSFLRRNEPQAPTLGDVLHEAIKNKGMEGNAALSAMKAQTSFGQRQEAPAATVTAAKVDEARNNITALRSEPAIPSPTLKASYDRSVTANAKEHYETLTNPEAAIEANIASSRRQIESLNASKAKSVSETKAALDTMDVMRMSKHEQLDLHIKGKRERIEELMNAINELNAEISASELQRRQIDEMVKRSHEAREAEGKSIAASFDRLIGAEQAKINALQHRDNGDRVALPVVTTQSDVGVANLAELQKSLDQI